MTLARSTTIQSSLVAGITAEEGKEHGVIRGSLQWGADQQAQGQG